MVINMNKIYNCLPSKDKVGIEFGNNVINIYFPLGYDIPKYDDNHKQEIEERKSILDLLKTISLCKNKNTSNKYQRRRRRKYDN